MASSEDSSQPAVETPQGPSEEIADAEVADCLPTGKRARSSSTPSSRATSPRKLSSPRERKRKIPPSTTTPQKERQALPRRTELSLTMINMPASWPRLLVDLPKARLASFPFFLAPLRLHLPLPFLPP